MSALERFVAYQAENVGHADEDARLEWECLIAEMCDEDAKLRELLQRALTSHDKMCTNRGTCLGCLLFNAKPFMPVCPIVGVTRDARDLGIEVDG